MTPKISSATRTRLALVAFTSLWLSACGGGGGGDTVAAAPSPLPAASGAPAPSASAPSTSAPTAGPATSPSPSSGTSPSTAPPSPAPGGASQFVAFGTSTVVTSLPPSPPIRSSDVARLNAGGGVAVWTDGTTLFAQRFDAGGVDIGGPTTVASDTNGVSGPRVAQLTGGGWVVVWKASLPPVPNSFGRAATAKLQFKRYAVDGTQVQDTTDIESAIAIGGFDVKGTADGGFAVASSVVPGPVDSDVVLQRFDGNGAQVGTPQSPRRPAGVDESTNGGETDPWLVTLPDNSLEMLWFRKIRGTTQRQVWMQHFDAQSAPIGDAVAFGQTLQDGAPPAGSGIQFAAAALSDGRIVLTWSEILGANDPTPRRQFWLIADQAGAVQTPVGAMSVGRVIEGVAVAPAGNGGFTLFSQLSDAAQRPALAVYESIDVLSVDNTGAAQGTWATLVSRLIVAPNNGPVDQAYSVAGGPDGHYVVSFQQAVAPNGGNLDVLGK